MYSLFHKRCVCIMPITNECQMFPWGYVSFAINVSIIQLLMGVPCVTYYNNCVPFNYLFTRTILFKEESLLVPSEIPQSCLFAKRFRLHGR